MFEHRLSKFCRGFLLVACLLLVSGLQQSCKDWLDDYKYDDSEPEWLGASVYAFLQEGTPNHSYKNYVELIDSLGERETLEKTGSKTLFVADDKAFERFYANNPWNVKSVAEMTEAQRKYLFYNTMLNNAILLDMMPNTSETSEGDCLSRETEFNPLDSLPMIHADYYPLHSKWPTYNKYWELFSKREDTLRMAMVSSSMIHFFDDYLKRNAISVSDINFIFQKGANASKEYKKNDVYLFGNKLVDSDVDAGSFSEDSLTISCKNGYVYRMDDVLLPPMDMASELRNNDETRIFSHLLDRFCIPVFDPSVTGDYRKYYNVPNDSVYSLKYFTNNYDGGTLFNGTGVTKPASDERLAYDPGASQGKTDVYAMLVPKDKCLYEYFADPDNGAGNFLVKNYAPDAEIDPVYSEESVDVLLSALDSIPQISIATFLNNLMQNSFSASVPSKFDRITNDANDDMGIKTADVDECLIANNGVIYLLNKVFSPAAYSSVAGPVDIYDNMSLMKKFIKDLKYNYYLLAMDADYSLVIPDNNNFVYYDPLTFDNYSKEGKMRMYSYHYDANRKKNNTKNPEYWYETFEVDKETFEIDTLLNESTGYNSNIATDLLEYLIIVHDKVEPRVHADRLYYSTKGYGTIKIDASDPENIKFYGGEQLEKGTEIVSTMIINQTNGVTYCTAPAQNSTETLLYSSIPTPPTKSVYQNMLAHAAKEDEPFYEFFNLCNPGASTLDGMFRKIYDSYTQDTIKAYSIFYTDSKMSNCVPFLNTYHYTVYVPENESVKKLYDLGLPTWDVVESEAVKNPKRALSMIRQINNVARYHFHDQSVYYDKSPFFVPNVEGGIDKEVSLTTSLINSTTGRFYELRVKSDDANSTILVQDEWSSKGKAQPAEIVNNDKNAENKIWNLMCRDRQGTASIETSSFSVIQPIDRVLLNEAMFGYDGTFVRYAENGAAVDTMLVKGGKLGAAGKGEECYLIAKAGRIPYSTKDEPQPAELENKEIVYLMQPIDAATIAETGEEGDSEEPQAEYVAKERLVYDGEGEDASPILITRDGYRVNRIENKREETVVYEYYTVADDKGNEYIIKVDNAGAEIARELYKEKEAETPETDGDSTGEENSTNGETSDEE